MKLTRILTVVIATFVLVVGVLLRVSSVGEKDAPTITCSVGEVIEAPVAVTDEELCAYVTAYDNKDGDLTSKVTVSRKTFFIEKDTLFVTFAVSDSDNNVTSLKKRLRFTDYKAPEILLNNDFVFPSGYSYDLAYYVKAQDIIDGDITEYVKLISPEYVNTVGTYPVNLKVSNSFADTTNITINAIVTNNYSFNTRIYLSTYITYVDKGAELDYKSFITEIVDKDGKKYNINNVKIDSSAVDTTQPGVYDVFYRIYSGKEEISMTRLVVVVKGAE